MVLVIGPEAWPFPIPLVRSGGEWRFQTAEGLEEIVNRRIGANERDTIAFCRDYLIAQRAVRRQDPGWQRRAEVRPAAHQLPRKAGRPLLGPHRGRRRGEPLRSPGGRVSRGRGTAPRTLPRVLLPGPDPSGQPGPRRPVQLCDQRQHDRRLCPGGLPGRVRPTPES